MTRRRIWSGALALLLVSSATQAVAQTPVQTHGKGEAMTIAPSARNGSDAPKPAQTSPAGRSVLAVSPLAPSVAPAEAGVVTGKVGSFAADRVNTAAAQAAALVPSAPRYVPVTIVNRAGGHVPALSLDDIGVIENGVRQRVTSIERWPLWLVVVLDVGRQIGPAKQLAVHRQLVYDLLLGLGEDDHVAVLQYADGVDLIQPWTQKAEDAEEAVMAKFESGLEGQLWDSVSYASEDLLKGKLGHKIVVVITDGVDDASRDASYEHASSLLRSTSTTLYIVNLSRYLDEQIRREAYGVNGVLNVITSPSYIGRRKELRQYRDRLGEAPKKMIDATADSGGKLWYVAPEENPEQLPRQIWQQIEGQFMVSYVPEKSDAPSSTVPIRAMSAYATRGDIEVRTPQKLFTAIVPPRSAPAGVHLRKK